MHKLAAALATAVFALSAPAFAQDKKDAKKDDKKTEAKKEDKKEEKKEKKPKGGC